MEGIIEKRVHTLGSRFSQDVHGIFSNPKLAVHRIIEEADMPYATAVPFIVVIAAAIMSAIGVDMWAHIQLTAQTGSTLLQILSAVTRGVILFFRIFYNSFAFLLAWVLWSVVFHFLGSIVSGTDIAGKRTFWRALKLAGFMFAPFFLNILPFFPLITGYWSVYLAYIGMKANYETTSTGALIVTLPYLFSVVYGTFLFLLSLF
ncbi:TPA: YIP1 family protein [archaeon]|uniref:YIP1 family protein n=1 Tax=Candidatus Naiadarchaeum limnaeum TaxID=2756139 RepID=A0A832XLQ6_9ARCH|nr:YIP1 family protein [Candidatus Naiadarchaeum limnaeum]